MTARLADLSGTTSAAQADRPLSAQPRRGGLAVSVPPARNLLAGSGLLVLLVGLAFGLPTFTLLGLLGSATAVSLRRVSLPIAPLVATLALLTGAIGLMSLAAWFDVDLISHGRLLGVALVALSAAVLVMAVRVRAPVLHPGTEKGRWSAFPYVPALLAGAVSVLQAAHTQLVAQWALVGTDLAEHTNLLGDVQSTGGLDYSVIGYPRGLQALLALVAAPTAHRDGSVAALHQDLVLMASVVWLGLACLLWAGAAVTTHLARSTGMTPTAGHWGAGLFCWFLLAFKPFQMSFVHMGAAPSMLAVVVLWGWAALASRGDLSRRGGLQRLVWTTVVAVFVLAHLWQALALVPAVGLVVTLGHPRQGHLLAARSLLRETPRRRLEVGALALVVLLVLALPPMLGVLRDGGLSRAAVSGDVPGVPLSIDLLSLVAIVSTWRSTEPGAGRRSWLGVVLGLLCVLGALMVSAGDGLSVRQYYPMKALWFTVLVTGPLVALGLVRLVQAAHRLAWRFLDARPAVAAPSKLGLVAAVWLLLATLVLPGLVGGRSLVRGAVWQTHNSTGQQRLEIASTYGTRYAPDVALPVALGLSYSPVQYGPYIIAKMLHFQTSQPVTYGAPASVCKDAAAVSQQGKRGVVVLTDLAPADLKPFMAQGGCQDLRVVQVPGADPDLVKWFSEALHRDAAGLQSGR